MKTLADLLCSHGLTESNSGGAFIDDAELRQRVRTCGRLLAAWPNARPASVDMTLLEYVNATRGVPIAQLGRLIDAAIQSGGEFIPPAGALIERVVKSRVSALGFAYNAHASGEQRAKEASDRMLRAAREDLRAIEPVTTSDLQRALGIAAGKAAPALGEGR